MALFLSEVNPDAASANILHEVHAAVERGVLGSLVATWTVGGHRIVTFRLASMDFTGLLLMDDYVSRVTQISHELQQAWDLDQLVKAQKTCSMILLQTHPFAFYLILDIIFIILVKWLVGFGNWMHLQLIFPGIGSEKMSGKPLRARSTPVKKLIGPRCWPIIYGMSFPRLGVSLTP
ncbi:hypothetical protein DAPPUDRAFT_336806 [Daphnia pulex]|uniref:Uncharacterized protein n=1 Tax=Daphnia pulex TaxID=6669 RepID=E9I0E2_DAPPU|nr:hypothetical protein DAPPUDRAFT_336806 [Daphnia pulex]|eukprot:EFX62538.1 hypothetical protein DAPPUDRAFT_336806 [Daphnia pulex]